MSEVYDDRRAIVSFTAMADGTEADYRLLDAFEREFWAGRHSRPALAAAPLRALVQQLPPPPDRPSPPLVPCPDLEHQRLYDEAARLWYATDPLHRCLHGVV